MKINTILFILFISSLTIASCKKEVLPPDSEEPKVLKLHCLVDNSNNIDFVAGEGGDYANSFKFYPYGFDSIFAFGASIEDTNRAGKGLFAFVIYNYRNPRGSYNDDIDHTIREGSYQFEYKNSPYKPLSVRIEWQQDSMEYFTSDWTTQPTSSFKVSKAETVVKDGIKYRKATIEFSCMMKNPMTGITKALSGSGVMAFPGDRM